MTKVGMLCAIKSNGKEELHGEINTLQMQIKIKLLPDNLKTSERAPDYFIVAVGHCGSDIQIGAAWKQRKQQSGDIDLEYLTLTIDDPSLSSPLNVAAFQNNDGNWSITWRRRQSLSKNSDSN